MEKTGFSALPTEIKTLIICEVIKQCTNSKEAAQNLFTLPLVNTEFRDLTRYLTTNNGQVTAQMIDIHFNKLPPYPHKNTLPNHKIRIAATLQTPGAVAWLNTQLNDPKKAAIIKYWFTYLLPVNRAFNKKEKEEYEAKLDFMLRTQIDINSTNALARAASTGKQTTVEKLLNHKDTDPNVEENGETALFKSLKRNHFEIIKLLASDPRTDFTKTNPGGKTALQVAQEKVSRDIRYREIVRLLQEKEKGLN